MYFELFSLPVETIKFPPIFTDRKKEIATLRKAINDCKDGRECTVLIAGEAGIEKTWLAAEYAEMCEMDGFVVLYSNCVGNNEQAYFPVLTALEKYAKNVSEQAETYIPPLDLSAFNVWMLKREI